MPWTNLPFLLLHSLQRQMGKYLPIRFSFDGSLQQVMINPFLVPWCSYISGITCEPARRRRSLELWVKKHICNTIGAGFVKGLILFALLMCSTVLLVSQDLEKYSATYIATWAGDTACIETFTIAGREMFGRSIQIFPEPHLQQFVFRYGSNGSVESCEIQYYDLKNTSRILESATGFLPYSISMTMRDDSIVFSMNGPEGETTRSYKAERMDYLGSWIPIMGQWEWLSLLMVEDRLDEDLTFVNKAFGVYGLELSRIDKQKIIFHGGLSLPITIFLDADLRIDSIDAMGSAWNFEITRVAPLDVERFAPSIAKQPIVGIASPRTIVQSTILDVQMEVDYSRPSKRGRKIFGYVVPYDRVWRAGANHATQISFDKDLVFGDKTLQKGRYNLFVIPKREGEWTLIFNTEDNAFGSAHDKDFDLESVKMQASETREIVEQFTIELKERNDVGELHMQWDNMVAKVTFQLVD